MTHNKDKLNFPVKKYTVTDKYGNTTHHTTRQTTIGKHIWTDADIEYYEKLQNILKKLEQPSVTNASDMVDELIQEIESEVIERK